jgi:octaheme c-type cytochrome (tetrathionate reductase family)
MKYIVLTLVAIGLIMIIATSLLTTKGEEASPLVQLKAKLTKKKTSAVDHSKFFSLSQEFTTPQQVTTACITCHNKRHLEVMQSNHWNWDREEFVSGRGVVYLGKKNAINNFCISTHGNEQSCAKCHIGFGMTAEGFAFSDPTNIDCLVCHDNTETYAKAQEQAGAPDPTVDLGNVARHVGRPKRTNCGLCHFYGGGGNNVKHGDLEEAMFEPQRDLDVHMAIDGVNMVCVDCHQTEQHNISGQLYSVSSMNRNRASCEQCHGETPHRNDILNEHTLKVACQTCHIPVYAKANATKIFWDWSTAGRLRDGKPYEEDDKDGNHTYLSIKGSFQWGRNLKPEYIWFNGTASHYLLGDVIDDTTRPLVLNRLHGSYADPDAKIVPVKIHRARQPYDVVNRTLVIPKLFASHEGEGALWKDFSWQRASETGMREAGYPYSGQLSFIRTDMYWPINHMVSTREATVPCLECHTRNQGRLAGLKDFYMPGRDYSPVVETGGAWLLILTLAGVIGHGSIRIVAASRRRKGGAQ